MRILAKFPSRSRPQIFLTRLKEWLDAAAQPKLLSFLVSYDEDDATMTPEVIAQAEAMHPSVVCVCGKSQSKIHAVNRDINEHGGDWDIIIVVSDDMYCRRKGWDDVIRDEMMKNFPDLDGALWFHDGTRQRVISTLSVMGRVYYERFRYIYYPVYRSFFSDNEYTDVSGKLGRMVFIEHPIATHEHPAWLGGMKRDELYVRNNVHWRHDEDLYRERKAAGFPL